MQEPAPPVAVGQEKATCLVTRLPQQTTVQPTRVQSKGGKDLNSYKTNGRSKRVKARDITIDHRAVRVGKREDNECKSAHISEDEPLTQRQSASMIRKSKIQRQHNQVRVGGPDYREGSDIKTWELGVEEEQDQS